MNETPMQNLCYIDTTARFIENEDSNRHLPIFYFGNHLITVN